MSNTSFTRVAHKPFYPRALSKSCYPIVIVFKCFTSGPTVDTSSATFEPTPSRGIDSCFLLPGSILASMKFMSLHRLLTRPKPRTIELPTVGVTTDTTPLLHVVLFVNCLLTSSSCTVSVSLCYRRFSTTVGCVYSVSCTRHASFYKAHRPYVAPVITLASGSECGAVSCTV